MDNENHKKSSINYLNDTLKQLFAFSALLFAAILAIIPIIFKDGQEPNYLYILGISVALLLSTAGTCILCQMRIINLVSIGAYEPHEKFFRNLGLVSIGSLFFGILSLFAFLLINFDILIGKNTDDTVLKLELTEKSFHVEGGNRELSIERDMNTDKIKRIIIKR